LQILEEPISWFRESLRIVEVLELCSLQCLFNDDLFEFFIFFDEGLELRVLWSRHPLLALRAVEVVEDNTRAIVLLLDLTLDTVDMVDVATL